MQRLLSALEAAQQVVELLAGGAPQQELERLCSSFLDDVQVGKPVQEQHLGPLRFCMPAAASCTPRLRLLSHPSGSYPRVSRKQAQQTRWRSELGCCGWQLRRQNCLHGRQAVSPASCASDPCAYPRTLPRHARPFAQLHWRAPARWSHPPAPSGSPGAAPGLRPLPCLPCGPTRRAPRSPCCSWQTSTSRRCRCSATTTGNDSSCSQPARKQRRQRRSWRRQQQRAQWQQVQEKRCSSSTPKLGSSGCVSALHHRPLTPSQPQLEGHLTGHLC